MHWFLIFTLATSAVFAQSSEGGDDSGAPILVVAARPKLYTIRILDGGTSYRLFVHAVEKNSSYQMYSFSEAVAGDEIVAINGVPLASISRKEWRDLLKKTARVAFRRGRVLSESEAISE